MSGSTSQSTDTSSLRPRFLIYPDLNLSVITSLMLLHIVTERREDNGKGLQPGPAQPGIPFRPDYPQKPDFHFCIF